MKTVVSIVTWNSEKTIAACVQSVLSQAGLAGELQIIIRDNASSDSTLAALTSINGAVKIIRNGSNTGFCRAHNETISDALRENADFVLVLNPDVRLDEHCIAELVNTLCLDRRAGSATPKLFRANASLAPVVPPVLDAAGMYMTKAIRHFDRGSGEEDHGQYDRDSYVFGGTGAALLLKRACIADLALSNTGDRFEVFDENFFAYREDADLAWRGQIAGWKCRYVPSAVGFHVRQVLPENRATIAPELNAMSVRNRFLLQRNNWSLKANWHCLPQVVLRNLAVIAGVLVRERSSGKALQEGFRLPSKRRVVQSKRRVSGTSIGRWFRSLPVSAPALEVKLSHRPARSLEAIIVNFNSGARIAACVSSLQQALSTQSIVTRITIVDNGSTDGSARALQGRADIRLLDARGNRGFAGALNDAIGQSAADALLVLNPDTIVNDAALASLLDSFAKHPRLGIVSPILVDESGYPQEGFMVRSFPTVRSTVLELFGLHKIWPENPWTKVYLMKGDPFFADYVRGSSRAPNTPQENLDLPLLVDQPAGACLLIRRSTLDDIGGFDEAFWPAWFEDVDLCRRVIAAGYQIGLDGRASVIHEGGYSTRVIPRHRFAHYWYSNLLRYWRKHGTPIEYVIVRTALGLALMLRSAASLVTSVTHPAKIRSDDQRLAAELFRLAFTGGA